MTPKEKAFHLYFSFIRDIIGDHEKAKQCALKVVNEMLNDHLSNKTKRYGRERYHFWQQVKQEIDGL